MTEATEQHGETPNPFGFVRIKLPDHHSSAGFQVLTPDGRDIAPDLHVVSVRVEMLPRHETKVLLEVCAIVDVLARADQIAMKLEGREITLAEAISRNSLERPKVPQ